MTTSTPLVGSAFARLNPPVNPEACKLFNGVEPNPLADQLRESLCPLLDSLCDGDSLTVELSPGVEGNSSIGRRPATDDECNTMEVYFTVSGTLDARQNVVKQMRRFLDRVERELRQARQSCRKARRKAVHA